MSIATEISRLQTAKADLKTAIEGKGVTVPSATKIDGYADLVDAIQTGGGSGFDYDDIADRTYATPEATVDIVIPTATRIPPFSFSRGNFRSISAPAVKRFTHYLSDATGNGGFVFEGCSNLQSVSMPELMDVGSGGYQFNECFALEDFYAPKANFGQYMFKACSSLVNIALGYGRTTKVETQTYMFNQCANLKTVDLSNISKLNSNLIRSSTKVDTLILRDNSVVPCGSTYVFDQSRFANGGAGGTIYVPSALIESYKTATNWSTYNGYGTITWAAIEGSIYETQYADGRQIT